MELHVVPVGGQTEEPAARVQRLVEIRLGPQELEIPAAYLVHATYLQTPLGGGFLLVEGRAVLLELGTAEHRYEFLQAADGPRDVATIESAISRSKAVAADLRTWIDVERQRSKQGGEAGAN